MRIYKLLEHAPKARNTFIDGRNRCLIESQLQQVYDMLHIFRRR